MTDKQKAIERAMRALAARAHSEAEIADKLARSHFDERTVAETMRFLAEHRLTDDAAFAAAWAKARARRGVGPRKIAWELREKGVGSAIAEEALASVGEDESLPAATALAQKHLRRGDDKAKQRAYAALARRGFPHDTIQKALSLADESAEDACPSRR